MPLTQFALDRIGEAYRIMAQLGYRPSAPSDGFGNITIPLAETDLDQECIDYARRWRKEEDTGSYWAGSTDGTSLLPAVLALEAFRLMNGGTFGDDGRELVPALLRRAAEEYERAYSEGE